MRSLFAVIFLLLLALIVPTEASKRLKHQKGSKHDHAKVASECSSAETHYEKCVPQSGDCGEGLRDVTCKERTEKIACRIPCNWKKEIVDCKYRFGQWGECDISTNTKSRSGTLKRAMFNAECQTNVKVSKPCSPKLKKKNKRREEVQLASERGI